MQAVKSLFHERVDDGYTEAESDNMSNFDHTIGKGLAEELKGGKKWVQHAAWNFCGYVWWDEDAFAEEVWVYGSPRTVMRASTLKDLMDLVNDEFGHD